MLHTIVTQVLSKNSHTTSGICNTNYKVALCCVSCQHLRLVNIYGLTRSGAMKYFEVHDDATHLPVLDVMTSCCGVRCIITTRPMVSGHDPLRRQTSNFVALLASAPRLKTCSYTLCGITFVILSASLEKGRNKLRNSNDATIVKAYKGCQTSTAYKGCQTPFIYMTLM